MQIIHPLLLFFSLFCARRPISSISGTFLSNQRRATLIPVPESALGYWWVPTSDRSTLRHFLPDSIIKREKLTKLREIFDKPTFRECRKVKIKVTRVFGQRVKSRTRSRRQPLTRRQPILQILIIRNDFFKI